MILSNCTKQDIDHALKTINQQYTGNVKLNNYQQLSNTGLRHRVTLRVLDSHGAGAHLSKSMEAFGHKARHTISACWHVHGHFFDALPPGSRIYSRGKRTYAGGRWDDFDVGSMMYPIAASESCKCASGED